MSPRAPSLPPDERRAHLIDCTLGLLRERGPAVTTREIAQAAGVAEGTIFRAFATKDDLVNDALRHAFDHTDFLKQIGAVPDGLDMREHLLRFVTLMQQRFIDTHELLAAMGMVQIPDELVGDKGARKAHRARVEELLAAALEPHREALRVEPSEAIRLVRLLTFSGSHPQLADGNVLAAEEIVDTVLYGVAAERGGER